MIFVSDSPRRFILLHWDSFLAALCGVIFLLLARLIFISTTRNLDDDNFTSGVIIQLMYCWLTMSPRASGECRLYKTCQLPKCELILDPQVGVPHAGAQRHLE